MSFAPLVAASLIAFSPTPTKAEAHLPGPTFGIAWGFLYGAGEKPAVFMPQLRQLGTDFTKLYLFWSQLEPQKGAYDWSAVDGFLKQLKSPNEALISIFASSLWATRSSSQILPPSPAKNPDDYYQFIKAVVTHCKGKIRYWQNDCEPNNPIFWAGTAPEFVSELKLFYKAVKDADPEAIVVCGGYDGMFNPPDLRPIPNQEHGLAFFDEVLKSGKGFFDVFDLRLYGSPYTIVGRVDYMRQKMKEQGIEKPIICTEYNGPGFFDFPENRRYYQLVSSWATVITSGQLGKVSTGNQITALYDKMNTLDPHTQMFMQGCPPALDEKRDRIACRDVVMRNVLALSAGVQKTMYWDIWHDTSKRDDIMHLMYGKLKVYEDKSLTKRNPVADALQRTTKELAGVEQVTQIPVPDHPTVFLFELSRHGRKPSYVVWNQRDIFSGEDEPPIEFSWSWKASGVKALDALGKTPLVTLSGGQVKVALTVTPIFLDPQ